MKFSKGFTLVELLVVVAIIGILATVVVVSVSGVRSKSRDARRISDIREIAAALQLYFNDQNQFPSATDPLAPSYIRGIPTDPLTGAEYAYNSASCSIPNQQYVIRVILETSHTALNHDIDDTTCTIPCDDPSKAYCISQ